MTTNSWLGLSLSECSRLAAAVCADRHDPVDVVAAVAASVITEPGDAIWGECAAQADHATVVGALVESATVEEFAAVLGLRPDAALRSAWARWTPRISLNATVAALEHAAHVRARVLLSTDEQWPAGLFDLGPHVPNVLFVRGSAELEWNRAIAIVGARAATGYGEYVAAEIAAELAASGCLIVSGGAYGIDGVAHRAALAEGEATVAFLAGGIDRLYPSGHTELLGQIAETGLLISETPCGTVPSKFRFLQRNRLIAAASQGTVVIEAGRRSGSLNTAGHAASIGRPLGAVPGPITSPASAGCHALLREAAAECVTSAEEVREMVWGPVEAPLIDYPAPELGRVRDALSNRAQPLEQVAASAGLAVTETAGLLAEAELAGWASSEAGLWRRVAAS